MTAYLLTKDQVLSLKTGTLKRLVVVADPQPAPWPKGGLLAMPGLWVTTKKRRYRADEPQSEIIDHACLLGEVGSVVRVMEASADAAGSERTEAN